MFNGPTLTPPLMYLEILYGELQSTYLRYLTAHPQFPSKALHLFGLMTTEPVHRKRHVIADGIALFVPVLHGPSDMMMFVLVASWFVGMYCGVGFPIDLFSSPMDVPTNNATAAVQYQELFDCVSICLTSSQRLWIGGE